MKHRLERVNEVMKRELGDLIRREISFQAKLVTVQQVDITPNLKNAHVYIGIIGTPEEQRAAMAQLHDHRTVLQHELAKRVVIKYTPHLHFKLDESIERGARVLGILNELDIPEEQPDQEAGEGEESSEHDEVPRREGDVR